jgi:hypothetical protein
MKYFLTLCFTGLFLVPLQIWSQEVTQEEFEELKDEVEHLESMLWKYATQAASTEQPDDINLRLEYVEDVMGQYGNSMLIGWILMAGGGLGQVNSSNEIFPFMILGGALTAGVGTVRFAIRSRKARPKYRK